jgi:hypothetical protein
MSDVIDPQAREIPVIDVAPFRDGSARAKWPKLWRRPARP